MPLLLETKSHGQEAERFTKDHEDLKFWFEQEKQSWLLFGVLETQKKRKLRFLYEFDSIQTQNQFLGPIPLKWVTPRYEKATFVLAEPFHGDQKQVYPFECKGGVLKNLINKNRGVVSPNQFHLEINGWKFYKLLDENKFHFSAFLKKQSLDLDFSLSSPFLPGQSGYLEKEYSSFESFYSKVYPSLNLKGTLSQNGQIESVYGSGFLVSLKSTSTLRFDSENEKKVSDFSIWAPLPSAIQEGVLFIHGLQHPYACLYSNKAVTTFTRDDIDLSVIEFYRSEKTKKRYPLKIRVLIKPLGIEIFFKPETQDQEIVDLRIPKKISEFNHELLHPNSFWFGSLESSFVQGQGNDPKIEKSVAFLRIKSVF